MAGVVKRVNMIARKPGTTREAFRAYYENHHAPMGTRYFPFEKYVRNHLIASTPEDVGFDVLMESWIDLNRRSASMTPEVDRLFAEDEHRFMKAPPRPVGAAVVEHLLSGPPRGVEPPRQRKAAWLLSADGLDRPMFLHTAETWGRGLAAEAQATRAVLAERQASAAGSLFTADAILTLWLSGSQSPPSDEPPTGVAVRARLLMEAYETPIETLKANFGKH